MHTRRLHSCTSAGGPGHSCLGAKCRPSWCYDVAQLLTWVVQWIIKLIHDGSIGPAQDDVVDDIRVESWQHQIHPDTRMPSSIDGTAGPGRHGIMQCMQWTHPPDLWCCAPTNRDRRSAGSLAVCLQSSEWPLPADAPSACTAAPSATRTTSLRHASFLMCASNATKGWSCPIHIHRHERPRSSCRSVQEWA